MTKVKMVVSGKVTRAVTVEGNCLAECEANAICEWASLVGGDYTTAKGFGGIKRKLHRGKCG